MKLKSHNENQLVISTRVQLLALALTIMTTSSASLAHRKPADESVCGSTNPSFCVGDSVRGLQRNDDINNHVWNGEIASFNPTTEKYTIKFNDNELKEWPTNQIARVKGCGAGGFCIDMLVRLNIANNSNEEMKVAAYNQSNETYTVVSTSAQSAQQYVDGLHATDLLKTTGESPAHIKIGDIMRAVQHNNSIDSIASGWTVQIIGYSSLVDAYAWVEVLDGPNDLKKQAW